MAGKNNPRSGELSRSISRIGIGVNRAAQDLNPIHPQSSFQASLLIAAIGVGFLATFYARLIAWAQALFSFLFQRYPWEVSLSGPLFFLAATWLVVRFAPEAKGSGIPQVLQAIDKTGIEKAAGLSSGLVSIRTAVLKVLSSALGILGGASIGREGPTVQVASSFFAMTARFSRRYFGSLDPQSYLIAGASAGISAAFNTPLAGITFALEEIAEHSFAQFKRTVMLAVIVGGITARGIGGNYLYFGHPSISDPSWHILPTAILLGILGGLTGGFFAKVLTRPLPNLLPSHWWGKALVCGAVCSVFGLLTHGDTAGSGYEVTRNFMESEHGTLAPLLFLEKLICTIFSYLSGMAGGIFSPCLSIGAGLGFTTGELLHNHSLKACALVGMVAFFSGAVQAPLTAVIIIMEMTDQSTLLIPFMVAALLAQGIGRLVMPTPLYRYLARHGNSKPDSAPEDPPEDE
ncbi:MAG TPA: chloride channel protein [bacterium]|nr:chloride channel protein [bacterium]